ncbi:MAG TPA: hypothetical protein HPP79_11565 [Gammaproteobacteria bacterium]|jgi:hypothetical protein|nr:hypothetical protein [Gammaproteobacteria bacterium]
MSNLVSAAEVEATKETEKPAVKRASPRKPAAKKSVVTINISKTETEKNPVTVIYNGTQYAIPRGKNIDVPPAVVEILNHAVETHVDSDLGESRDVHRYPFQIISG